MSSCTKKFEEYNTNPIGISNQQLTADYQNLGGPLKQAQLNIVAASPAWVYQLTQNLNADIFSGYMMTPSAFNNNVNNTNYFMMDGWNGLPWSWAYDNVMSTTAPVLKATTDAKYAAYYQWAKILRVEAMHRVSDVYGPIIYTHYGNLNADGSVTYDSQQEAYNAFFADLDSAINVFTNLVNSKSLPVFAKYDLGYGGSYDKWLKFANTLRLRLAIRINAADPVKAKLEGEKALANSGGLLTTNDDNLFINIGTNDNPLKVINNDWGDIRLGAPLASILNGYSDKRITKYALPATDPLEAGKFIGIRNGVNIDAGSRYSGYSKLIYTDQNNVKYVQLMVAAEAWFLKAEAALNGWTSAGDAQTNYEKGISTSFDQNGISDVASYLADATSKAQPYVDPKAINANYDPAPGLNDVPVGDPNLTAIPIKWNAGFTNAQKLEQIITQKWIALYPDGVEAWSEFRRTRYPKLFPVVINNSAGKIPTAKFIRRLPFASGELSNNTIGVQGAITKLGGPDTGGTPLWWDKN
ncbi:MAG: SusD/RagB family nutrient-binding outer membrane lipoprotein [Ginsengibacter sp.]